jgi:hypothetical protein
MVCAALPDPLRQRGALNGPHDVPDKVPNKVPRSIANKSPWQLKTLWHSVLRPLLLPMLKKHFP